MAGITSTKKIKGQPHLLAYITPNEVEKLKALGGQETMTAEGIPAYPDWDVGMGVDKSHYDAGTTPGGSTFETHRGNRNIGVDNTLKAKYGTNKQKQEAKAALDKGQYYGTSKNQNPFEKLNTYNTNFQKRQNIKLAQKRAFQKYQDIEQYVDLMDDYGLSAEQIAELTANAPKGTAYGYDFSGLEKGKEFLGSNIGTNLEKYRANLYDVNSSIPGRVGIVGNFLANKVRPDTQVTALNTLQKARDYNTLAMDPDISRDKLETLANRGKTPDQINPPRDGEGGNQQVYLPYEQVLPEDEYEREQKEFAYRFGTGQILVVQQM